MKEAGLNFNLEKSSTNSEYDDFEESENSSYQSEVNQQDERLNAFVA